VRHGPARPGLVRPGEERLDKARRNTVVRLGPAWHCMDRRGLARRRISARQDRARLGSTRQGLEKNHGWVRHGATRLAPARHGEATTT
jgi:hypothetical protein